MIDLVGYFSIGVLASKIFWYLFGQILRGESWNNGAPGYVKDFFAREFWRFVLVQQYVAKLPMTAIDYPPMQDPVSFKLDAVKKKIEAMIKQHEGE